MDQKATDFVSRMAEKLENRAETQMIDEIITMAHEAGIGAAAVIETKMLTFKPEYRKFCEENLCGKYDKLPMCPPACGTVEEMRQRAEAYTYALVLQNTVEAEYQDEEAVRKCKAELNAMTVALQNKLEDRTGMELLMMGAGPYKNISCLSAYCIDAQLMADAAGMDCWKKDGKVRYFSLLLF